MAVSSDLMQSYGRDNKIVPKHGQDCGSTAQRDGEHGHDWGQGMTWLEQIEETLVLGKVQTTAERDTQILVKLIRGFRAMLVVLWHYLLSLGATLNCVWAVVGAMVGYQAT